MGPLSEESGDVARSLNTSPVSSPLQWGRSPKRAETLTTGGSMYTYFIASMGPLSEESGDIPRLQPIAAGLRLASMGPLSEESGDWNGSWFRSEVASASMGPLSEESGDPKVGVCASPWRIRFNGAALRRERRRQ